MQAELPSVRGNYGGRLRRGLRVRRQTEENYVQQLAHDIGTLFFVNGLNLH